MGFFKKISTLFQSPGSYDPAYWIQVKCSRCGEVIRTRIDLHNDLSLDYGEGVNAPTYFCRKTIIGPNRCYQQVEVELTFDQNHHLINREIHGGEFVEEKANSPAA